MSNEQYQQLSELLRNSISDEELIQAVRFFLFLKKINNELFSYNYNIFIIHQ